MIYSRCYSRISCTGRSAGYRLRKVIDRKPAIDLEDEGIVPSGAMKVSSHLPSTLQHISPHTLQPWSSDVRFYVASNFLFQSVLGSMIVHSKKSHITDASKTVLGP